MSCRETVPSTELRCFLTTWTPEQLEELGLQLGVRFQPGDSAWDRCQQLTSAINQLPAPVALQVHRHCQAQGDYVVAYTLVPPTAQTLLPPGTWMLPFRPDYTPVPPGVYSLVFPRALIPGAYPGIPVQLSAPLPLTHLEFTIEPTLNFP